MLRMDKNDHAAIQAVLSGNKDAYRALVVRHSHSLFRVAFRITGNEADADDVVQEAFLRGYLKLETFQSRANFGTWIYRIAVRCALDKIRSANRMNDTMQAGTETNPEQDEIPVADEKAGPDRLLLSGEIAAMQTDAMFSLTPTEQAAFTLRHMEGRTTEQIGDALGVAPNAAKQAVFRAVQKLRRRLSSLKVRI